MSQNKLKIHPQKCTGCRSCELACSFHFKRYFSPIVSSVKIFWDQKEGKMRIHIDEICDLCLSEEEPLCVKYCVTGALEINR